MAAKYLSTAAVKLKGALAPAMNQAELAAKLGVKPQAVSNWVRGFSLPEPRYMAAIERILGIPMSAWVEQSETQRRRPIRRKAA